jgi:hypothetical protein
MDDSKTTNLIFWIIVIAAIVGVAALVGLALGLVEVTV